MYTLPNRGAPARKRPPQVTNNERERSPQSSGGPTSAGKRRAGSSVLALRSRAQVRSALRRLLLLPHFEAGEQLDQPDIPLLRQEQEEEAQADDDNGDDPNPVEDYLTGVVINHCTGGRKAGLLGGEPGAGSGVPPRAGQREVVFLDHRIVLSVALFLVGRGCLLIL